MAENSIVERDLTNVVVQERADFGAGLKADDAGYATLSNLKSRTYPSPHYHCISTKADQQRRVELYVLSEPLISSSDFCSQLTPGTTNVVPYPFQLSMLERMSMLTRRR